MKNRVLSKIYSVIEEETLFKQIPILVHWIPTYTLVTKNKI
jgi:hypothetical protein